jgi:hypothetical protein
VAINGVVDVHLGMGFLKMREGGSHLKSTINIVGSKVSLNVGFDMNPINTKINSKMSCKSDV